MALNSPHKVLNSPLLTISVLIMSFSSGILISLYTNNQTLPMASVCFDSTMKVDSWACQVWVFNEAMKFKASGGLFSKGVAEMCSNKAAAWVWPIDTISSMPLNSKTITASKSKNTIRKVKIRREQRRSSEESIFYLL